MVIYCCVNGCNSNCNSKKKDPRYYLDPSSMLSFHAFPRNLEQKSKWAKAIGRPTWNPSSHVRICSMHFSHDQFKYEGCRKRIKDDAVPTKNLPLNSNFEATDVEACRICLATDLKLHSLQDTHLGNCMDSITGFNTNCNIEGLPQYVCYQCGAWLIKFDKFVEKVMIAQATLLDIFAKNGEITTDLIMQQNREKLNLTSSLKCCKAANYYVMKDGEEISKLKSNSVDVDMDVKLIQNDIRADMLAVYQTNTNTHSTKSHSKQFEVIIKENDVKEEICNDFEDAAFESSLDNTSDNETKSEDFIICEVKEKRLESNNKLILSNLVKKKDSYVTLNETNIQKYFDVVQLSLEEQIDKWKKARKIPMASDTIYECNVCFKFFAQSSTYRLHMGNHDPSRGEFVCPVCKLRYKTDALLKSHINRAHAKKFYCKTCPKSFNNVCVAKQHVRWHAVHKYKCAWCAHVSAHASALRAHERLVHAHAHACALCGRACVSEHGLKLHIATAHSDVKEADLPKAYRCEPCNIGFASEDASLSIVEELKNVCNKCGVECKSRSELISHTRVEHPRSKIKRKKHDVRTTDTMYPIQCPACDKTILNRRQHSQHARRKHPKETDVYCPVVACVCDTCGQGFQNSTKLQMHKLRHGNPTVRCTICSRMFYDKYGLERHATAHITNKPHQCRTCMKTFKRRLTLERHNNTVHSDVTPYECSMCDKKFKYSTSLKLHMNCIHFKLPQPPKKRKGKGKNTKVANKSQTTEIKGS